MRCDTVVAFIAVAMMALDTASGQLQKRPTRAPTPFSLCSLMKPSHNQICQDGGKDFCTGFVDFRGTEAHHGTCTAYCEQHGLKCSNGWDDDEGPNTIGAGCPPKGQVGCNKELQTQICRCVPKNAPPTKNPTPAPPITVPSGYERHPERCVYVAHETDLTGKTPQTCADACDADPTCLGFELFHNYQGRDQRSKPGDCHLIPLTQNMKGCPGERYNLDYYAKKTQPPTLAPGQTGVPTRVPTPKPTPFTKPPSTMKSKSCAPGYTLEPKMQNRCYKAIAPGTTRFTWLAAQTKCRDDQPTFTSGLATITNVFENEFVRDLVRTADPKTSMWSIGANDIGTEGQWKWSGEKAGKSNHNRGVGWPVKILQRTFVG